MKVDTDAAGKLPEVTCQGQLTLAFKVNGCHRMKAVRLFMAAASEEKAVMAVRLGHCWD